MGRGKLSTYLKWKSQNTVMEVRDISTSQEINQNVLKAGSNEVIDGNNEDKTANNDAANNAGCLGKR